MPTATRNKGILESLMNNVNDVDNADNTEETPSSLPSSQIPLQKKVHLEINEYDVNINQNLITVTEDKIMLCLNRNLQRIGRKRWLHPMSLLSSMLLALATSEFDKLTWVSPELLKATFIVSSVITTGWLVWEIMRAGELKQAPQVIDEIFRDLRGSTLRTEEPSRNITFDALTSKKNDQAESM